MAIAPDHPPTPETPYWRDSRSRRTTVAAVLAGRARADHERVLELHTEAVCRILRAAAAARLERRPADARALAAHASRLCGELAGLWPAGSNEPLG
jgi:hypothetical protein